MQFCLGFNTGGNDRSLSECEILIVPKNNEGGYADLFFSSMNQLSCESLFLSTGVIVWRFKLEVRLRHATQNACAYNSQKVSPFFCHLNSVVCNFFVPVFSLKKSST